MLSLHHEWYEIITTSPSSFLLCAKRESTSLPVSFFNTAVFSINFNRQKGMERNFDMDNLPFLFFCSPTCHLPPPKEYISTQTNTMSLNSIHSARRLNIFTYYCHFLYNFTTTHSPIPLYIIMNLT